MIERKLFTNKGGKLQLAELEEVGRVQYMSVAKLFETFGPHLAPDANDASGESAEHLVRSYDPLKEFVLIRLYLSAGSGDALLYYDVMAFEDDNPEWTAKASAKVSPLCE